MVKFTFVSAAGTDIYGLWILAGDLGYVIVFPQFLMAVHWPSHVNMEGSIAGAITGIGKCTISNFISKITIIDFNFKITEIYD